MHRYIMNVYTLLIRCMGGLSAHIGQKTKHTVICLALAVLSALGLIRPLKYSLRVTFFNYSDMAFTVTGVIALLALMIVTADKEADLRKTAYNRPCVYGWLLCFIMIFATSFIHPVSGEYRIWAIVSLLISLPSVMIWAAREDYGQYCALIAKIMTAAACVFVMLNLLVVPFLRPDETPVYTGLMDNPNGNGMVVIGLYAASLFLLLTDDRALLPCSLVMSFCIALSYVSECRTAELAILLESLLGAGYCIRAAGREGKPADVRKIILTCAAIIVIALAASFVLRELGKTDLNAYAEDNYKFITSDEDAPECLKTLDLMTARRVSIWRAFLCESTFWGNGAPEEPLLKNYEASIFAHNNAVEILYTSGVLAFAGYVIFLMSGIVFVIRCMLGRYGYKKEHLLVMLAFTGYFTEAMMEVLMYPVSHMPAILLNLCMMPIFIKHPRCSANDGKKLSGRGKLPAHM